MYQLKLDCKAINNNRFGLCQPPSSRPNGRDVWLWSVDGDVADGTVPFSVQQEEPRFTLAINRQVVDYFAEQGTLSSLAVTVDYRRLAAMLGGENRDYTPQVANNLLPIEAARLFPTS